jgi:VWFA-related protein
VPVAMRILPLPIGVVLLTGVLAAQAPPKPPPTQPPPAASSQQADQPPQRPAFRTETNFVRVDAFASRDGVPVHDLRAEDFEVFEDGVAQAIQTFEHVLIAPAGPQDSRVEPNTAREGEQMAALPRNRVFVIFLDVPHVNVEGSHNIQEPLIRLMDRVLGADDLVAVMTPEMSPNQITFARKTEVIQRGLRENWPWGMRDSILPLDQYEIDIQACYPPLVGETSPSEFASRLMDRRRERMVLEALNDLALYLGGVREERKAILTITQGWRLYRPDQSLLNLRSDPRTGWQEQPPGVDPIGIDPWGKLTTRPEAEPDGRGMTKTECDTQRMALANMDNDRYFRDLLDIANRANASFYPIDPRGLAAVDAPIGPKPPPPPQVDQAILRRKLDVMQTLAINTDGLAVINSNDIDRGLKRIAADLTSYYLLGYYSTNARLDGRFRTIKVRVKPPGVDIRARRGYKAATAEEVAASRAAAAAPAPSAVATAEAALAMLARIRPDAQFRIHASPTPGPDETTVVWVAGELATSSPDARRGGTASVEVAGGGTSGSGQVTIKPGERAFLTSVPLKQAEAYDVRVRLAGEGSTLTDAVRVETGSRIGHPIAYRRGPTTGNRLQPAADFRFSRTERLRLELPLSDDARPGSGRVLDKTGGVVELPISIAERTDVQTGQRWLTADLTLASLGAGDFIVELAATSAGKEERVLTAIRVTR